jgi:hypothetical protein
MNLLARIFGDRNKPAPPPYDAAGNAYALINSGVVGNEEGNPRFYEFLEGLQSLSDDHFYKAIPSLRALEHAGSHAAGQVRRTQAAARMGRIYLNNEHYIPAVVEYGSAYVNGGRMFDFTMRDLAQFLEQKRPDRDSVGVRGAIMTLCNLPEDPKLSAHYLAQAMQYEYSWPADPMNELVQLWTETPGISQALKGDLGIYRAYQAQHAGAERMKVYKMYTEAVGEGLSPKLDRDACFEGLFSHPAPTRS